jgi:NADPH:quinone reductase-like Zn-dependent oxidoreductase/thioesterase domain-containing protein/SAM-dependent methyltransferase/acyl carrier protein
MLAVALSATEVDRFLETGVSTAAVNGPRLVTVAGGEGAVARVAARLEHAGVWHRPVRVNHAFHSPLVEPAREPFLAAIRSLRFATPERVMISTVTGAAVQGDVLGPEYWWDNICRPVRFGDAVAHLDGLGVGVAIELGPHPVLGGAIRQTNPALSVLPSLSRGEDDGEVMMAALAGTAAHGAAVDWGRVFHRGSRPLAVPRHPWRRERCWRETSDNFRARLPDAPHPLLGRDLAGARRTWHAVLDPSERRWLPDHRVHGQIVFPAAGFVEMLAAAASRMLGTDRVTLDDVQIRRALVLPPGRAAELQTMTDPSSSLLSIAGQVGEGQGWIEHCQASYRATSGSAVPRPPPRVADPDQTVTGAEFYSPLERVGLEYGEAFRGVRKAAARGAFAEAQIRLPDLVGDAEGYGIHPALLDAALQSIHLVVPPEIRARAHPFLPDRITRVRVWRRAERSLVSRVMMRSATEARITVDVSLVSTEGESVLELEGFSCRAVAGPSARDSDAATLRIRWRRQPPPELPMRGVPLKVTSPLAALIGEAESAVPGGDAETTIRACTAEIDLLDNLARRYAVAAFEDLTGTPGSGAVVDIHRLLDGGGLIPDCVPQVERSLAALGAAGLAARRGDGAWAIAPSTERRPFAADWRVALARCPEIYTAARLLELAGRSLADVWRGRLDRMELLFSDEATRLLEILYSDAPWPRFANGVIAGVVAAVASTIDDSVRPLRILEVGAGTGGTTDAVLRSVSADRLEYWFTDVSAAFLAKAERRFAGVRCVRFHRLDLERDLAPQNVPPGGFDLVIAADVLHATADIGASLRRCADALTEGGLLVIRELCQNRLFNDVLFGLSRDWWSHLGDPLRADGHRIGPDQWRVLFQAAGLGSPVIPPATERLSFATVMLAQRTGPVPPSLDPPLDPTGAWIVVRDDAGTGERLAASLRARGRRCITVTMGGTSRRVDADRYELDPEQPEGWRLVVGELGEAVDAGLGIVHLTALDVATRGGVDESATELACVSVLSGLRALADCSPGPGTRVFLVTRGAQLVGDEGEPARALQGALLGLGRVGASEFPELDIRMVDLDPGSSGVDDLLTELATSDRQEEVAWRRGSRYVPRLERVDGDGEVGPASPAEAVVARPGDLGSIAFREGQRRAPGPGEIRVEVRFVPLNFRDVLKALGAAPADDQGPLTLGDEGAGIVREVGPGVAGVSPGDPVVFAAVGTLRSEITLPAGQVVRLPEGFPLASAATIPVAFATAEYALSDVGRLAPGETVLIHAAAGGVGMAALQLASRAGGHVLATAGSPAKRELVEKLGAGLVLSSRTVEFADQIREATSGRGVDLVLNSLAGQAMAASLGTLAPGGRFLELGKRDFAENTRVGLWPLRRSASYHAIDLSAELADRPERAGARLTRLVEAATAGRLTPLPYRLVPAARAVEAFRLMAQGGHVGKIVLDLTRLGPVGAAPRPLPVRSDRTYLISGGLGGVGMALAERLVRLGARSLLLLGRRGVATTDRAERVAALRAAGVEVRVAAVDVADGPRLEAVMAELLRQAPPVGGVFHLAMILADGSIRGLDRDRFRAAFRPKAVGAWNLHRLTKAQPVELFVMFGSAAAALGSPGQVNYAAGNAVLEALAAHRRAAGLPATTLALGAIAEIGCVAERPELGEGPARLGVRSLSAADLWRTLDAAVSVPEPVIVALSADWNRLGERLTASGRGDGLFTDLVARLPEEAPAQSAQEIRAALAAAAPVARLELARAVARRIVAKCLGADPSVVEADRPLTEMGLDSLMAVELAHVMETELGVSLPLADLASTTTVDSLAARVLQTVAEVARTPGSPPPAERADGHPPARPRLVHLAGDPLAPTVVCIHPAGGDLAAYETLAPALGVDCAVYGVESRLMTGAAEELSSLAALADSYANLIATVQPVDRPIHLVGFSIGGLIAVATAAELERRGWPVELVATIETDLEPVPPAHRAPRLAAFLTELFRLLHATVRLFTDSGARSIERLAIELAAELLARVDQPAVAVLGRLLDGPHVRPDVPRDLVREYLDRVAKHLRLLLPDQRLPPPAATVARWQASEGLVPAGSLEGWPEPRLVPAGHFGIVRPPSSLAIAADLREQIWAAANRRARLPRLPNGENPRPDGSARRARRARSPRP